MTTNAPSCCVGAWAEASSKFRQTSCDPSYELRQAYVAVKSGYHVNAPRAQLSEAQLLRPVDPSPERFKNLHMAQTHAGTQEAIQASSARSDLHTVVTTAGPQKPRRREAHVPQRFDKARELQRLFGARLSARCSRLQAETPCISGYLQTAQAFFCCLGCKPPTLAS